MIGQNSKSNTPQQAVGHDIWEFGSAGALRCVNGFSYLHCAFEGIKLGMIVLEKEEELNAKKNVYFNLHCEYFSGRR